MVTEARTPQALPVQFCSIVCQWNQPEKRVLFHRLLVYRYNRWLFESDLAKYGQKGADVRNYVRDDFDSKGHVLLATPEQPHAQDLSAPRAAHASAAERAARPPTSRFQAASTQARHAEVELAPMPRSCPGWSGRGPRALHPRAFSAAGGICHCVARCGLCHACIIFIRVCVLHRSMGPEPSRSHAPFRNPVSAQEEERCL